MNIDKLTMNELFEQLGVDGVGFNSPDEAIQQFIRSHSPLAHDIPLHKAAFWTPAQSAFLEQCIAADSEWSYLVDELDALLRQSV